MIVAVPKKRSNNRGQVFLEAISEVGTLLEERVLSMDEYYEDSCELLDSGAYRQREGVRIVRGKVYDLDGNLDQAFENRYSENGALEGSRAIYADG